MKETEGMFGVCHISTVHPMNDIRIFEKECQILGQAGYEVRFIVPHERSEEIRGIKIIALPKPKNRFARAFQNGFWAYRKAKATNARVFHFHDPELLPVGFLLALQKKTVIYDVHEDLPLTIRNKHWIPAFLRSLTSRCVEKAENFFARRMDLLVAATPTIRNRFSSLGSRVIDVKNFPLLSEFQNFPIVWAKKERAVCYVGDMNRFRGIVEMTRAIRNTSGKLILAGTITPSSQRNLVSILPGWERVEELGRVDRQGVRNTLARSMAGLVLLHARANYLESLPIKMFEYMAAGIPVIASDFPLWRKIINENRCGFCCDPLNFQEIGRIIQWIFDHPEDARNMGENGRKAVIREYNWDSEASKLLEAYRELLDDMPRTSFADEVSPWNERP